MIPQDYPTQSCASKTLVISQPGCKVGACFYILLDLISATKALRPRICLRLYPKASPIFDPLSWSYTSTPAAVFDYSEVAVEIWHQILLAVIDLPYVLDTLVDRETDHWRSMSKYHDLKIYTQSEEQRKMLRLVCASWREFADGWKYRWINYDAGGVENVREQREALEAIQSIAAAAAANANAEHPEPVTNGENGAGITSQPRRILFHVNTKTDMELFRSTIDHASSKVTTLFVRCRDDGLGGGEYADEVFEYMTSQSSKLPMLRCLALPAPNSRSMPLQTISKAFPNLITLTINSTHSYRLRDEDQLLLPDLETLGLDIASLPVTSLLKWDCQGMIHLATPLGRHPPESNAEVMLEPIRSLGANLTFLNIYRIHQAVRLPPEFWTWCPCLVEFLAFFSWVYLDTPASPDHPLKYVVHWPHYDNSDNPLIERSSNMTNPVVLHCLQLFPPGVKVFAVWHSWEKYFELLAEGNRYPLAEKENILITMNRICKERDMRVEDQDKVPLEEFLVSAGIGMDRP